MWWCIFSFDEHCTTEAQSDTVSVTMKLSILPLLLGGALAGNFRGLQATKSFNRIATFFACSFLEPNCNDDTETVAEIAAVTEDGLTVIYTDGAREVIGMCRLGGWHPFVRIVSRLSVRLCRYPGPRQSGRSGHRRRARRADECGRQGTLRARSGQHGG